MWAKRATDYTVEFLMPSREEIIRTPEQKEAHKAYRLSLKREEIRGGILKIIQDYSIYGDRGRWLPSDVVRKIQAFEHSQGVVIKVDREQCSNCIGTGWSECYQEKCLSCDGVGYLGEFIAFEPLI